MSFLAQSFLGYHFLKLNASIIFFAAVTLRPQGLSNAPPSPARNNGITTERCRWKWIVSQPAATAAVRHFLIEV
jgi:hypothetical protein